MPTTEITVTTKWEIGDTISENATHNRKKITGIVVLNSVVCYEFDTGQRHNQSNAEAFYTRVPEFVTDDIVTWPGLDGTARIVGGDITQDGRETYVTIHDHREIIRTQTRSLPITKVVEPDFVTTITIEQWGGGSPSWGPLSQAVTNVVKARADGRDPNGRTATRYTVTTKVGDEEVGNFTIKGQAAR